MFQLQRMGPRCSSAETQVCHRSYIITASSNHSFLFLSAFLMKPGTRLNRQIWYRHPNSEAGKDEIQNVQREDF
jgi:hypothetical protein